MKIKKEIMQNNILADKAVIVTGAFGGIGLAIAKACLDAGALVLLHGRNETELPSALKFLSGGKRVEPFVQDIRTEGFAKALVDTAIRRFGRLDGIANNAAWVVSSRVEDTSLPLMREVLEVNALAPFAIIQAALPHLAATKGAVVNIGSVNAYAGEPGLLAYSVSKGALMTLTRNLGDSLHRDYGIRVNQLNAGWVLTDKEQSRKVSHGLPSDWHSHISPMYAPARRLLDPKEIANSVVFWLSDLLGPVSGQAIELEQHPIIGRNPEKNLDALNRG